MRGSLVILLVLGVVLQTLAFSPRLPSQPISAVDSGFPYLHGPPPPIPEGIECNVTQVCRPDWFNACVDVCEQGSVVLDEWTQYALKTQRRIQQDKPLNKFQVPGTHNSGISLAHGYGVEQYELDRWAKDLDKNTAVIFSNQLFSLTDQMRMGIRALELDTHWIKDDLHICHAGFQIKLIDNLLNFLKTFLHLQIEWDSESIGCGGDGAETLKDAFTEIANFLNNKENNEEIIIMYFDDQMDLETWDKVPYFVDLIGSIFGPLIFSPADKQQHFPNSWPTPRELISLNKRALFVSRQNYSSEMTEYVFARDDVWSEFSPVDLQVYPDCKLRNTFSTIGNKISRVLGDSLIFGPFYNGTTDGLITTTTFPQEVACDVTYPTADQVYPELMKYSIWTWKEGHPTANGLCSAMTLADDGRWISVQCNDAEITYAACQSTSNPYEWVIAQESSNCPNGYEFLPPVSAYQNNKLKEAARSQNVPENALVLINWIAF